MKENAPAYPEMSAETVLYNLEDVDDDDIDRYIGNETKAYNLPASPFRNPYDPAELGQFEALEHFRMYFYHRYLEDVEYRKAVHQLESKTLGCWCYPDPCHGTVLVDLLNKHIDGGDEAVFEHIERQIMDADPERLGVEGFKHKQEATELLDEYV